MKCTKSSNKLPFRLYLRKPRNGSKELPIYYVQFRSVNSKRYWTSGKSTGKTDKTEATIIAYKWLASEQIPDRINARVSTNHSLQLQTVLNALRSAQFNQNELTQIIHTLETVYDIKGGIVPNTAAAVLVNEYMLDFWDKDKSAYLREKEMSGKPVYNNHANTMRNIVKNFWLPKYGNREIGSFTKQELQKWLWDIKETDYDKGQKKPKIGKLSHVYVNRILRAGLQPLKYAYQNQLIKNDCFTGFNFLSDNPKKKQIFTLEQAEKLFNTPWLNPTAKLANQLAMLTGLRIGEILALTPKDLGVNKIYVQHSFAVKDGLKCPKNGETRIVTAPSKLLEQLRKQGQTNPYGQGENGFLFWSTTNPNKPFDNKTWGKQLRLQLKSLSMENVESISFHSWRHFFSTYIEPKLTHSELQKVTGHLDEKMLEHYTDHETEIALEHVGNAVNELLLPLAGLSS